MESKISLYNINNIPGRARQRLSLPGRRLKRHHRKICPLKTSDLQNEKKISIWSQSYKRNLVFKMSKLVLNYLTAPYLNLDHCNMQV